MPRDPNKPQFAKNRFEVGVAYYSHELDKLFLALEKYLLLTRETISPDETHWTHWSPSDLPAPVEKLVEPPLALLLLRWNCGLRELDEIAKKYLDYSSHRDYSKRQRNEEPARDVEQEANLFSQLKLVRTTIPLDPEMDYDL